MIPLVSIWNTIKTNSRTIQVRVSGKRGRKSAKPKEETPNEGNWSEVRANLTFPKKNRIVLQNSQQSHSGTFASHRDSGNSEYVSTLDEPPSKRQKSLASLQHAQDDIKQNPLKFEQRKYKSVKKEMDADAYKNPSNDISKTSANSANADQNHSGKFPVLVLSDADDGSTTRHIPHDRLNEVNLILSQDEQLSKPVGNNSFADTINDDQKISKVPFPIPRKINSVLKFSPPDSVAKSSLQQWSTKKNTPAESSSRQKKKTEAATSKVPTKNQPDDHPLISDYTGWKQIPSEGHPLENCRLYDAIIGLTQEEMSQSAPADIPRTFCQTSLANHIKNMLHPYQSSAVQYSSECGKLMKYWESLAKGAILENPYQAGKNKYQIPVVGVSHEIALMSKPYGRIPECIKGASCLMLVLPRSDEFAPYIGMTFVTKEQLELVENGIWSEEEIREGCIQQGLCYLCLCFSISITILQGNVRYSFPSHQIANPINGTRDHTSVRIVQPFKIKLNCADGFTNAAVGRFATDDGNLGAEPFRYVDLAQFTPTIRTVEVTSHTDSKTKTVKQIVVPTFRPMDSLVFDPCKTYTTEFQPILPKYNGYVPSNEEQINTPPNYEYFLRMHLRDERKIGIPAIVEMGGNPKVIFSFYGDENFETWRQRGVPCRPQALEGYSSLTKTYIERKIGYILLEGRPFDYIFAPIERTVEHLRLLLSLFGFLKTNISECGGMSVIHYPAWRMCKSLEVIPETDLDLGRTYWHALHLRMNVTILLMVICSRKHKGDKKQAINDHLKAFLLSHSALYEFYLINGEQPCFFLPDSVFSKVPTDRVTPVCLDTRGYHMVHEHRTVIQILSEPIETNVHIEDLPFVVQPEFEQKKIKTPSQKILEFMLGPSPDNPQIHSGTNRLGLTIKSFPMFDFMARLFGITNTEFATRLFSDFETTRNLFKNHLESQRCRPHVHHEPPDINTAGITDFLGYVENYHTENTSTTGPCYLPRVIKEMMSAVDNCEFWFPFPDEYKSELSQTNICDCRYGSIFLSLLFRVNASMEFCRQIENSISALKTRTYDELRYVFPASHRDPHAFTEISRKSVEELEELQYNLRLFANTHIELVYAIHSHGVYTDQELTLERPLLESHQMLKKGTSILESAYPHDTAYLCEEDLPNVCHMNTILRSVISELQKCKIVKMDWVEVCSRPFVVKTYDKKYPANSAIISRGPNGNEYDPAFGNEAFLKLVVFVGLCGLYRHSKIHLSFKQIVELYAFTQDPSNTSEFERFVHERPLLVKSLISEYNVWMTTRYNIIAKHILESEFKSWPKYAEHCLSAADSVREKYKLLTKSAGRTHDDPRKNFGKRDCLAEIENSIALSQNKKLFVCKKPGKSFLRFMVQVVTWLENRIQKDTVAFISQSIDHQTLESIKQEPYSQYAATATVKIGLHAKLISLEDKHILQQYVLSLVPGSNIDLNQLYMLRDSRQNQMFNHDSMETLSECFHHYNSDKATQSSMEQLILKLSPFYYDRVCYFFHVSASHYSVTSVPLSYELSIQQAMAVWYKFHDREGEVKLPYIPDTAHMFVKSPCCDQVNTHTAQSGSFKKSSVTRIGSAQIAYDPFEKMVTCNRKLGTSSTKSTASQKHENTNTIESQSFANPGDFKMPSNLSIPPKRKGPSFLKGKSASLLSILDIRSSRLLVFATLGNSNKRRFMESCGSVPVCRFPGIGHIIQNQSKKDGSIQSFTICPRCGTNSIFSFMLYGINGFTCYVCDINERKKLENEPCLICKIRKKKPGRRILIIDDSKSHTSRLVNCSLCHKCSRLYEKCVKPSPDANYSKTALSQIVTTKQLLLQKSRELISDDKFTTGLFRFYPLLHIRKP